MNRAFFELVSEHFGFIEHRYGFHLHRKEDGRPGYAMDGCVEQSNSDTVSVVDSNQGAASVWFYCFPAGRLFNLTPVVIDEYLRTNPQENSASALH